MTKRFVGQVRVDSSFHTCHTNSTHKFIISINQLLLQLPRRTKNLANNSGAIKLLSSRHSCRSAIATAQLKDHHQRRAVKGDMSKKRCNSEALPLVGSLLVLYNIESI